MKITENGYGWEDFLNFHERFDPPGIWLTENKKVVSSYFPTLRSSTYIAHIMRPNRTFFYAYYIMSGRTSLKNYLEYNAEFCARFLAHQQLKTEHPELNSLYDL